MRRLKLKAKYEKKKILDYMAQKK